MKTLNIVIDADQFIFQLTEGKFTKNPFSEFEDEGEDLTGGETYVEDTKPYMKKFKTIIKDIVDSIAVDLLGEYKWDKKKSKVIVVFSDSNGNFRYDIYPDYKASRRDSTPRSKLFYALRKKLHKKYGTPTHLEADDVVAYYVRKKGFVGASFDKDLYLGVGGVWFNTYYSKWNIVKTSEEEAYHFNMIQTLAGDSTDNIKGLPRVAYITARKLLDQYGWNWAGVVKAYESKGLTYDDANLTYKLIMMNHIDKCKQSKNKKKGFKCKVKVKSLV